MKSKSKIAFFSLILSLSLVSCLNHGNSPNKETKSIAGDIIVFHAGSLSVPFQKIARAFELENPGTRVLLEASGSVDCARKITDMHKPCDLMASSDYNVIEKFLIPGFTSWQLPFAGNEMVIAYNEKSRHRDSISQNNWYKILLGEDTRYGRSNPNADPCGYRTLMVMQLAGIYYKENQLKNKLSAKDTKYIRPKEVDMLALLELNEIDYIFIYKSVAIQHGLKYLELPDEINLKNLKFNSYYQQVAVSIKGSTPESIIEVKGETIAYSVTLLNNAPNPSAARAFLQFMLNRDKGMKILEESGHNSLLPYPNRERKAYPDYIQPYITNSI